MFRGGPAPASLLPAGPEARARPRGAASRPRPRRPALLPRHRQRAARAGAKESSCGCAGVFSAPAAIELYARAFDAGGPARPPRGFASFRGADFYRLPRNRGTVLLERRPWTVPASLPFGAGEIVPMCAGETLEWKTAAKRRTVMNAASRCMRDRFRGFLPVVVDVETGGFISATDALLEIAAVLIEIDPRWPARARPDLSRARAAFRGRAAGSRLARGQRHRSVPSAAHRLDRE